MNQNFRFEKGRMSEGVTVSFLLISHSAATSGNVADKEFLSETFLPAQYGHPVLLTETFVDTTRFTGACYRAANWQVLGQSDKRVFKIR